jgi:hypothetical protein
MLTASPHLAQLTHLVLSHNLIGNDGIEALLRSPHLSGLRALDVSYNIITSDDLLQTLRLRFGNQLEASNQGPGLPMMLARLRGE